MNRLAVYALTAPAADTARRLAAGLAGAQVFLPERLAAAGEHGFTKLAQALAANWPNYQGHLVLAASGVVVRAIAPLLESKAKDPAVVVLDGAGRYAVSLLSGHLGGANDLARQAARVLGGAAVITTATDAAHLPSLEQLAAELGWRWDDLKPLAAVSRELVEGRQVPVYDPGGWLTPHLTPWPGAFSQRSDSPPTGHAGPGVWVHWSQPAPGGSWLALRPPCLAMGLGMNRGTSAQELVDLVERVLSESGLSPLALATLASAEIKNDEAGLLELAEQMNLPLRFFTAEQLKKIKVPHPSAVVAKHLGTKSVCEAAAILAASKGPLLATKQKSKNATCAVALIPAASST